MQAGLTFYCVGYLRELSVTQFLNRLNCLYPAHSAYPAHYA